MNDFVELHLQPDTLAELGLPDIAYPVPRADFDPAAGKLPLALLLYGLQWKSARPGVDWQALEAAMERLALLMTPGDEDEVVTAEGDDWELAIGGLDLQGNDRDRRLVAVQRGAHLIAALRPLSNGQLRVAVYRPLDAGSARLLIGLAQRPHPEYGVQMRKNNWEFAMASCDGEGNAAAEARGEAHLAYWDKGLGLHPAQGELPAWRQQAGLKPLRAASVAAALGACYTFSDPG